VSTGVTVCFRVMTEDLGAARAARAGVAQIAATEPSRLRRCSAAGLLALLSAAALAPVAVAGGGALAAALAGVAGNVGSGLVTGVIDAALARLRDGKGKPADTDAVRDVLAADLLIALEKGDSTARTLGAGLTDFLGRIDGFKAAVDAARDDLHSHLLACFNELATRQNEALVMLDAIDARQQRQEKQVREQVKLAEEMTDRLRLLTRYLAERLPAVQPGPPPSGGTPAPVIHLVVPTSGPAPTGIGWRGGAEIAVGDRVYLLHSDYLEERFCVDHSVVVRTARGLRQAPAGRRGQEYVWLRQAKTRQGSAAARAALGALSGEGDLLKRLGTIRGLPLVGQLAMDGGTATLVLEWPTSRSGGPCDNLETILSLDGAPMDSWRMFRLFTGLAGLCDTLATLHDHGVAHRYLTPSGIIMLDDSRLVLRDLGLAARGHEPGEGPAAYQAPEQRRGGNGRPGSHTDVYQLAAVAYHLVAGHPPHARTPLPLRSQARGVPERISEGLDAALALDPGKRPDIRALGHLFRAACADLS
jgi:hypothetical protein